MKKTVLTLSFICLVYISMYAQAPSLPPAPGSGSGNVEAPLDGFTWMLVLSSVGYGAHVVRQKRNKSENVD